MNKYVIIGSSAVAIGAVQRLLKLDTKGQITVISKEQEAPYNKCFLVDYLANSKKAEQVYTKPLEFFKENNINLILGQEVVSIDSKAKKIKLNSGQHIDFDKLLLSMGSSPYKLNLPGCSAPGIFEFHTLEDTLNLKNYIKQNKAKSAIVVGAGLTGLECADALWQLGLEITIVERGPKLLARCLNDSAGQFLKKHINSLGVKVLLSAEVKEIILEKNKAAGVALADNVRIKADLIVLAPGVRPNFELAQYAGLALHNNFVVVNGYLQTSNQDIFAAGDLICIKDLVSEQIVPSCMWQDAMLQGAFAANNMVASIQAISIDQLKIYSGSMIIAQTHVFGKDIASCGSYNSGQELVDELVYQKIDDGKGFLLVGCKQQLSLLKRSILKQI